MSDPRLTTAEEKYDTVEGLMVNVLQETMALSTVPQSTKVDIIYDFVKTLNEVRETLNMPERKLEIYDE